MVLRTTSLWCSQCIWMVMSGKKRHHPVIKEMLCQNECLTLLKNPLTRGCCLRESPFHWLNELLQIRVAILPYQREWVQASPLLWHTQREGSHWKSPLLLQPFPNLNYNKRNPEVGEITEDGPAASCQNNQRHNEKIRWRKWKRKARSELKACSFFLHRPSLADCHEVRDTV